MDTTTRTRTPSRAAGGLAHGTLVVVLGTAVGMFTWITAMLAGVAADVIGVVFHDPADHPYQDAWVIGSVVLASGLAGSTWWAAGRRRSTGSRPR